MTLLLLIVTFLVPPAPASGQAPPTGHQLDELTAEVASQLRCPVCRQLSVQDSEAELSREVKGVIRERLAAGETPEDVKAYFVSKYGEWILLAPPKHGFTLLVWVLPLLALGGGGLTLTVFFRRWLPGSSGPSGDASASPAPSGASNHALLGAGETGSTGHLDLQRKERVARRGR